MKRATLLFLFIATLLSPLQADINNWTSTWITHPSFEPTNSSMILFRKSFDLGEKPNKFIIHLSADNHYRLFVNGKYITRGPARGDLAHWFYETIDIAPNLTKGKNCVAVEVVNWGVRRSFTFFSQMTSFILEGDGEKERILNTNGSSWKCIQNRGYSARTVDWMNDRGSIDWGLYLCNPTDSINANFYPFGWEKTNYDDTNWVNAVFCDIAGSSKALAAGGIVYSNSKLLKPRSVGLVIEKPMQFTSIRRTSGIDKNDAFIKGSGSLVLSAKKKISILIDQTYETIGYPELMVSGGKGSKIVVTYAENLIEKPKSSKGDRNSIDGKYIVGIKDIFIPNGDDSILFKPTYLRSFRFIQLDIETDANPLTLVDYHHVTSQAPINLNAKFETNDSTLNWIMSAGWRTVSLCAQDILMSDAAYEQMQYVGDSRIHNLVINTLSGDDRLTRNALTQFNQSRISEGLTLACYPNAFRLVIPSYSLIWIDQLYDYLLWKNDRSFLEQHEQGVNSVIDWFEQHRNANGLLGKMEGWCALAWPKGYTNGVPPQMEEGNNALYSLHYAYTLRHAVEMFKFLGKESESNRLTRRADEICKAVNKYCRREDGFYRESITCDKVSQITNIMAILAGATSKKESKWLMSKLLENKDWFGQVDLFLHLYLFEAMNKTGNKDHFFEELSEWYLMKKRGMTTFAEVPLEWGEENQRSECHPWSTVPNYFFFRTICGIQPLTPGHEQVLISPFFGHLTSLNAIYPHYKGNIELNLTRDGEKVSGTIVIPDQIEAKFSWKGKTIVLKKGKQSLNL